MDCGVPFCHTGARSTTSSRLERPGLQRPLAGCNSTPACHQQLPEFTAASAPPRAKPLACWHHQPPVSIKLIERSIVERAWDEAGFSLSLRSRHRQARRVVGSGLRLPPRQQLRRGHSVTVYEKAIIGDFCATASQLKLEKHVIDRRIEQMRAEGVTFVTNAHVA